MAQQLRQIVHGGLGKLDEMMGRVIPSLSTGEALSDEEALTRYMLLHRGNPRAIADFAATSAPKGKDPLSAAHEYEQDMERRLAARMK